MMSADKNQTTQCINLTLSYHVGASLKEYSDRALLAVAQHMFAHYMGIKVLDSIVNCPRRMRKRPYHKYQLLFSFVPPLANHDLSNFSLNILLRCAWRTVDKTTVPTVVRRASESLLSLGSISPAWIAKLPFEPFKRKAVERSQEAKQSFERSKQEEKESSRSRAKAELIKTILEITLNHRLRIEVATHPIFFSTLRPSDSRQERLEGANYSKELAAKQPV
ncbi:hypothetical protein BDR06DRAFT_997559 [Suillus hirtellus]|nr:hypothetical protein BDR06DRAFT_997559 [Suillus hirtellus]